MDLKRSKTEANDSGERGHLFSLPQEIRDQIYRLAYGTPTKPLRPRHPYDDYPSKSSPAEPVWFCILDRKIRNESQTLLAKEYDQTFYFDDVPTLYDFVQEMKYKQMHAKFCLRRRTDMTPSDIHSSRPRSAFFNYDLSYGVGKDIRDFIESQPGFCHDYNCALGYHPWGKADLDWLWRRKETVQRLSFQEGGHEKCPKDQEGCRKFFVCEYPPLAKSLRLKGYAWERPEKEFGADVEYAGGLVLEGSICDLSFDGYAPEKSQQALDVYRQNVAEATN